jgi:flagellar FliL protein
MTVTAMPAAAQKGEAAASEPEEKKKGGLKKILIILVALVAVGGGAYWFVLKPKPVEAPKPGEVVALDPIQINLEGEHYLRIGIALQLTAATKEADGSKALDATITEFSGLSIAEVNDPKKRAALKKDLQHHLGELYEDEVMGVYFTEFVTQ